MNNNIKELLVKMMKWFYYNVYMYCLDKIMFVCNLFFIIWECGIEVLII